MQIETNLQAVDYPHPFDEVAAEIAANARRYVAILSPALDAAAFDTEALSDALRRLLLDSAQSEVRILLQSKAGVVGRGHRLLNLARRMPSRVKIRLLRDHPDWDDETIVICDRDTTLFRPPGSGDRAFLESEVRPAAEQRLELFDSLWRYSEEDPDLRLLTV